jgi:hypothetical protein
MELLIDIAIVVGIEYLLVAHTFWTAGLRGHPEP